MKRRPSPMLSIHYKWFVAFGFWLLFLSGGLAGFVGSPGILQLFRLNNLLDAKKTRLTYLQRELLKLQADAKELETNRPAQLREIRRVLGYAATDEMVFDFSSTEQF